MKNKIKFITIFLSLITFLSFSQPALALEVNYPTFSNVSILPTITASTDLMGYILYFFVFAVITSGIVGLFSIVTAGTKILFSGGNPSSVAEAKERIWDTILGIILLMFAVIILRTINPDLVGSLPSNLDQSPGVYTMDASGKLEDVATEVEDTTDPKLFNPTAYTLVYLCTPTQVANRPKILLLSTFDKKKFGVSANSNTVAVTCNSYVPIGGSTLSLSWTFESAGVYYYLKPGCTGLSSGAQNSSGEIPFFGDTSIKNLNNDTVKSIRIVSGIDANKRYGVVLNKNDDFKGECSLPITNPDIGSKCFEMTTANLDLDGNEFKPVFAKVMTQNPIINSPDQGAAFYSNNFVVELGGDQIGLQYSIYNGASGSFGYNGTPNKFLRLPCNPSDGPTCPLDGGGLGVSYTGSEPPQECKPGDEDKQTCLNDIQFNESYYTIAYAKNDIDTNDDGVIDIANRSCGFFNNDVGSLKQHELFEGGRELYRLEIIPRI